ncbi:TonB-dependent receptor domain-containing protein [Variovorax sp. HJSM1_2]|uniref:TonB-dependent receptor domain-containing protein n=1 Tax=Variovorax sp. HJSM1_2 TaxID=3366263 RepID=UPI003BF51169
MKKILSGACCGRLVMLPFAVSMAMPALAQTALPETVVTATRVAQPLTDLVSDVSIVDRATIERSGATGVADVLARLPGVEVSRSGGIGSPTSVFIRGGNSQHTAVYLDGVRLDVQSGSGGASWESIPLAQIERIEVLRGPAAAVYGSDAIGGVIQLFTRKGEGKPAPYVGVGVGSKRLGKIEAGVSGSTGASGADNAIDYSFGVAREISDGYNIQPQYLRKTSDGKRNPDDDGYRSTSGNARVGLKINSRHSLDATWLGSDMDAQYDDFSYNPAAPVDDHSTNRLSASGLNWNAQWTDAYSTRISVTDSVQHYETNPSFYQTKTNLRGYVFLNEWRLGAHLLTATLERRENALDNTSVSSNTRTSSQNGVALGYGYNQGAHSLQLNARYDDDSGFGGKSTGSAAYGYAITPHWRATASAATAFRAPTLYQRYSEYGKADLQPETSRNLEAGLRYTAGASSIGAVVYRNKVDNLITFVNGAGACVSSFGCYEAVAQAQYQGVTFSGSHALAGVNLRASVDLQNPTDEQTGKDLARRARRHASLGADTTLAGWTLGAELQASGARFDDAANNNVLGGYGLINLSASTRIGRDLSLLARVDNLGDKDYQTARTYATPGRTLYVGLKWAPQ